MGLFSKTNVQKVISAEENLCPIVQLKFYVTNSVEISVAAGKDGS